MGTATEAVVTGKELLQRSDLGPCELVEGRIKKMSPTGWKHGSLEARLSRCLSEFVSERALGEVLTGEVGIYTRRDPDTVRGADVLFISSQRLEQAHPEGFLDIAPELVVEIMSPSNTWEEVRRKIEEYFGMGVECVWIVEPANRVVLVYRSATEMRKLTEGDVLEGRGKLQGFSLPISTLFAE